MFRQFADIAGFLSREAKAAHAIGAEFQDSRGGDGAVANGGLETPEDNVGYTSAQLLGDNRPYESFEDRFPVVDGVFAGAANDGPQDGVFFEMLEGGGHFILFGVQVL